MKRYVLSALVVLLSTFAVAQAKDADEIIITHVTSRTGPFEAYGKQIATGFQMGLEYLTNGTMKVAGKKITVISKDDQGRPDLGKAVVTAAYADDKSDIVVGPSISSAALAALPVAEENKKLIVIDAAVADSITGDKWNRYVIRTARNSSQDAIAAAASLPKNQDISIAVMAQDYVFGHEAIATFKDTLAKMRPRVKIVHEEYLPMTTTDFTAGTQHMIDALKDIKKGRKIISIVWAGAHPLPKVMAMQPQRYGIEVAPGGNLLPVMAQWKEYPGLEGAIYYYYGFPKNKFNDWLVKEHEKRFHTPPDFFTAGGAIAAAAIVEALKKTNGDADTEKLIAAMEGMTFDSPKGKITIRKEDHQALQDTYVFRSKKKPKNDFDLLELVRVIPASEIDVPIKNKR